MRGSQTGRIVPGRNDSQGERPGAGTEQRPALRGSLVKLGEWPGEVGGLGTKEEQCPVSCFFVSLGR